ncbi:acyl-CoA dehydrogenase family protein [Bradyrhizobium liaoningense]
MSSEEFRSEVAGWLEANCPPEMRAAPLETERCWGGRKWRFQSEAQKVWLERMAKRGWTAPQWPTIYGGGGLDDEQAAILRAELERLGCRSPLESLGIWMLGPALLKFGSEEQKRRHLPAIVRGEIRWCQGYSEPEAGSDLASLKTQATDCGDHFVISGRKIWTSHAHNSDWIFCLVRTDPAAPKHSGISFLLVDLATPGISTRPITLISGLSNFCEVTFDNVVVDKSALVGELNKGWNVAKYLLTHERDSISNTKELIGARSIGRMAAEAAGTPTDATLESSLRARIARYEIDALAFGSAAERASELRHAGLADPAYSSVLKYASSELNKRKHELRMVAGGTEFLEWDSEQSRGGHEARSWLRSKGNSIEGGTSEIQLNVIAKRILRLPGS